MIKITLLQYLYYYEKMTITNEQIEKISNGTTKIITHGIIEGKACKLLDLECLESDDCYLIL